MTAFEQMLDELRNQQELLHELKLKLDELEVGGGGGGPVGPVHASDVITENDPSVTATTNAQASLDELYDYVELIDSKLDEIL